MNIAENKQRLDLRKIKIIIIMQYAIRHYAYFNR
jgi:hypothetical protein